MENPSSSAVGAAIAELIEPIAGTHVDFGGGISFKMQETYSAEQAMMSLGLSANHSGFSFSAKHNAVSSHDRNVITASFIKKSFTDHVDHPSTPADLFSADFSLDDLREQEQYGRIARDNIPVFLSSVTYGRILYATISTTKGFEEMTNALKESFNSGASGQSAELSEGSKHTLNESQMIVCAIGIEDERANALIRTGKIQEFFASGPSDCAGA